MMRALATLLLGVALCGATLSLPAAPMHDSSGQIIHDSKGRALGSFEVQTDFAYLRLAHFRLQALVQLRAKKISKAEAQRQEAVADHARGLINAAVAVCSQDANTYQCVGDESKAAALLRQALGLLPKDTP